MRVLPVRPDNEEEDIAAGRVTLREKIDHPSQATMIVRGNDADVAHFADRCGSRSSPFPYRETVWVQDTRIFTPELARQLFDGHDGAAGVVVDYKAKPVEWLTADATLYAIDRAFRNGETSK